MFKHTMSGVAVAMMLALSSTAIAAVTADEAASLKTTLYALAARFWKPRARLLRTAHSDSTSVRSTQPPARRRSAL